MGPAPSARDPAEAPEPAFGRVSRATLLPRAQLAGTWRSAGSRAGQWRARYKQWSPIRARPSPPPLLVPVQQALRSSAVIKHVPESSFSQRHLAGLGLSTSTSVLHAEYLTRRLGSNTMNFHHVPNVRFAALNPLEQMLCAPVRIWTDKVIAPSNVLRRVLGCSSVSPVVVEPPGARG